VSLIRTLDEFVHARFSREQRRFIKFLVVGGSGVPVNLGFVFLTTTLIGAALSTGTRDSVAYIVGIAVSIFTNFLLNHSWTWGDRTAGEEGHFFRRLAKFYLVSSLAAVFQFATSAGLSTLLRDTDTFTWVIAGEYRLYHAVAPMAGILVGLVLNYGANNLWTFRKKAS